MPIPNYLDIFIEQNSSFTNTITLLDNNNNPINLTNYIISSQLKPSYIANSNTSVTFSSNVSNNINGVITLSLPWSATSNLKATRWVYDVLLFNVTSNNITRILEGTAYVSAGVTSPYIFTP